MGNSSKTLKKTNIGRIKENITNEVNIIVMSIILSIIITIVVCLPVKGIMFKEQNNMYGIVYASLNTLQYKVIPFFVVMIPSVLVSYIFNKDFIKKLYYIKKYNDENFKYLQYLVRIIALSLMFILVSYAFSKFILPKAENDENTIKYICNYLIVLGILFSVAGSYILFLGVDKKYYIIERQIKKSKIKEKYCSIQRNLNNKYKTLFSDLSKEIKAKTFSYNNENLENIVEINNSKDNKLSDKDYGLLLIKEGNILKYTKTYDFTEAYTNDGKYMSFTNQIKNIGNKYGSYGADYLKSYFYNLLDIELCNKNLTLIECIEKNELNNIEDEDFNYFMRNSKKYLSDLIKINFDINNYLTSRLNYLDSSKRIAESGYKGEKRVKEELDKYKGNFINIENKCFNFKYIDFIEENYTMECDNILVTQRGIFVIETKNKDENSVYIDEATGDVYNKKVLHIESDGRWIIKNNDGSFKEWNRNPVEQNRDHIIKLEKIINHHLGYDRYDDEYIEIKGIIVIANKNIKIENDLKEIIDVCRPEAIYEHVMKYPKNPLFTKNMIQTIVEIIESYDEKIHKPTLYNLINVEKELTSLDNILNDSFANNINYCRKINDILSSYYNEFENLNKDYLGEISNI